MILDNTQKSILFILGTTITLIIMTCLLGCGNGDIIQPNSCTDVYTQAFCDSIRGLDGKEGLNGINGQAGQDGRDGRNGEDGIQGPQGETGATGDTGLDGRDGEDGANGRDGTDGLNGSNGTDGKDAVIEIINPCGQQSELDEVILRFNEDTLYAVFFDGKKLAFMTILVDGDYTTTDGTECKFSVKEGEVIW